MHARSSLEHEFNLVSEALRCGDPALWPAVADHPRVEGRARTAIGLLSGLSPRMDEGLFRRLADR